ncbi:MAG: hypothetical protein KDC54_04280 [Lewinella sp.]|nr:hypothetical protein [Lewinella sp.]
MLLFTLYHNGHEIAVHNSWKGQETVYYDGQMMASAYSVMGKLHEFSVREADEEVTYQVQLGLHHLGVRANVWRNGSPLFIGLPTGENASFRERKEEWYV